RRAGRSFWGATELEVRLRQIRRCSAQNLVLLLQQPVPPTQFTHLGSLILRLTRAAAFLDIGLLHPVRQRLIRDPEVLRDLRERHPALTRSGNRDNVLA